MSPLSPGDTIAILAPARRAEEELLEKACRGVMELGFQVLTQQEGDHSYFSGSDEERAAEFMRLWLLPEVKALWTFAGGYGSMRLLPLLDPQKLCSNPKIFIGMSDITALHLFFQKLGMVTFLGPCARRFFAEPIDEKMHTWLWTALKRERLTFSLEESHILCHGQTEAPLVGGNLSLIASLLKTPWEIETKGKILILEEVNEEPYRIDRMLCQLKYAGKLSGLKGVILASFANCLAEFDKALQIEEVFQTYFREAPYPVVVGFPSGHLSSQATLPLGERVLLDTEEGVIRVAGASD